MRRIAVWVLAAVVGCRGADDQAPPTVSEKIEVQQRRSEEAFEQAREAQIQAREQQEQAEAAVRRVEAARADLAEAQRELERERAEAHAAQQQALAAGRRAARIAEESQRAVAQSQQQLLGEARRAEASGTGGAEAGAGAPGEGNGRGEGATERGEGSARSTEQDTAAFGDPAPDPAENQPAENQGGDLAPPSALPPEVPAGLTATGEIVESNREFVVVAVRGGERLRLGVRSDTRVTIGDRPAAAANLPAGAPVRVIYRSQSGSAIASEIEVLTGGQ